MRLAELVDHLDRFLQIRGFRDASLNGLQVEGSDSVERVGLAVDASLESILLAAERGCDLLVVHHGLFWGGEEVLRGHLYRRIRALIHADMALYAAHLPLDAHPLVGNNVQVARILEMADIRPFAHQGETALGVQGRIAAPVAVDEFAEMFARRIGPVSLVLRQGPDEVSQVGVVTGSATDPSLFAEASREEIDVLVTGEPKQAAWALAQEYGLNVLYGGHYRTETFGLKALGEHLSETFGLPVHFIEVPCPL